MKCLNAKFTTVFYKVRFYDLFMIFLYYNVFVIKVIFIFFLEKLAPIGGYGFTKSEIQI